MCFSLILSANFKDHQVNEKKYVYTNITVHLLYSVDGIKKKNNQTMHVIRATHDLICMETPQINIINDQN